MCGCCSRRRCRRWGWPSWRKLSESCEPPLKLRLPPRDVQQVPIRARRPAGAVQEGGAKLPEIGAASREIDVAVDRHEPTVETVAPGVTLAALPIVTAPEDAAGAAQGAGGDAHGHLQRAVDQERAAAGLLNRGPGDGAVPENEYVPAEFETVIAPRPCVPWMFTVLPLASPVSSKVALLLLTLAKGSRSSPSLLTSSGSRHPNSLPARGWLPKGGRTREG